MRFSSASRRTVSHNYEIAHGAALVEYGRHVASNPKACVVAQLRLPLDTESLSSVDGLIKQSTHLIETTRVYKFVDLQRKQLRCRCSKDLAITTIYNFECPRRVDLPQAYISMAQERSQIVLLAPKLIFLALSFRDVCMQRCRARCRKPTLRSCGVSTGCISRCPLPARVCCEACWLPRGARPAVVM